MLNQFFPYFIYRRLWGDRESFASLPDVEDPDWKVWLEKGYTDFYQNTQQKGIGNRVCNLAYPAVSKVDFNGKIVLEVGPGHISHLGFMKSKPKKYFICDVEEDFLYQSKKKLDKAGILNTANLRGRNNDPSLPFPDESFDIIISFNTLEHLYPLDGYLLEMKKKLKTQGLFLGGIPCEGGLAWGLGRFLTTRRYVHQNYSINYDKIICWEHPNFADYILERLNFHFEREYLKLHPFSMLSMDFNLVASFIYRKI
jgi:SAM-dependent methyltransferase